METTSIHQDNWTLNFGFEKEIQELENRNNPLEIMGLFDGAGIVVVKSNEDYYKLDNIRDRQKNYSIIIRRRVSNGNTRPRYSLENKISLLLSNGDILELRPGFEWDLSTTPRILWSLFPPDGQYELGVLVHDFIYVNKTHSRKFADKEMLKWSMAVSGTKNKWSLRNIDNYIRYYAVRLFGWIVWNKRKKNG